MIEIFALTTRGLETISASEMKKLPSIVVRQIGYRRIAARHAGPVLDLLSLRTVDDIFLNLAEWYGISQHKNVLAKLHQLSTQLELWKALSIRSQLETATRIPTFSVTANYVGKRNYSTDEIKHAVAAGIESTFGWVYQSNDNLSNLNIRLFIEHEVAYVGMRLGNGPLHKRPYKKVHVPGSLKPTIAGALLLLADLSPNILVLDPCCGAGTILIEAAHLGATAVGGDNDPSAITATKVNSRTAGIDIRVQHWDARNLPFHDSSIDRIITNLPWGRQVEVDEELSRFYQDICSEMQRVLTVHGRLVLLTNVPRLVTLGELKHESQVEISLFGQTPAILVFSKPVPSIVRSENM